MSNSSMKIRDPSPIPWPDVDLRSWNFNPATKSPIDDTENEKMEETIQKEVVEEDRQPAKKGGGRKVKMFLKILRIWSINKRKNLKILMLNFHQLKKDKIIGVMRKT